MTPPDNTEYPSDGMMRWALRELLGALPERRDWLNPDAENVLRAALDAPARRTGTTAVPWAYGMVRGNVLEGLERTKAGAARWVHALAVPLGPIAESDQPPAAVELGAAERFTWAVLANQMVGKYRDESNTEYVTLADAEAAVRAAKARPANAVTDAQITAGAAILASYKNLHLNWRNAAIDTYDAMLATGSAA